MITERYTELLAQVRDINPDARVLLAVKHQSLEAILEALGAGGTLLGHNIIQQLVAAEEGLSAAGAPPHETHVIGHVQSNKARDALTYAQVIETLDSIKQANRFNTVADSLGVRRDVFIQVNSSGAESQFGCDPDEAERIADHITSLPHLSLTGLMTIGAHTTVEADVARSFDLTRSLGEKLSEAGHDIREYSMGMTGDYKIALAHGSTIIRVGSAVFGPRDRA